MLNYAFDVGQKKAGKNAELVGGNMIGHDPKSLSAEFAVTRKIRPDIEKPVWHCSIALPVGERLDSAKWREITDDFVRRMGFGEKTMYVAVRHSDTEHDHVHLVVSRVGLDGKVWLGQWEARRAIEATQAIELEHGLTLTPGLGTERAQVRSASGAEINAALRIGIEPPRKKLQRLIDEAVQGGPPAGLFMRRLVNAGVGVSANIASTGRMNGFAFEIDGIPFKGSDLGKKYGWAGLQKMGVTHHEIDNGAMKMFRSVDPKDKQAVQAEALQRSAAAQASQQVRAQREAAHQAATAQAECEAAALAQAAQERAQATATAQAECEAAALAQAAQERAQAAATAQAEREAAAKGVPQSPPIMHLKGYWTTPEQIILERTQGQSRAPKRRNENMNYTQTLEAESRAINAKAAADLRARADRLAEQVATGEKSAAVLKTANEHVKKAALLEKIASAPIEPPHRSLLEKLAASWSAMLAWIKDLGPLPERVDVDTQAGKYQGKFVNMDELHVIQKTGRTTYHVHLLKALDRKPEMNNIETRVQYESGRGRVTTGEPDRGDRGKGHEGR